MGTYLNTSKVKVFPSTRRVQTQTTARLMTEAAMVGIINQLVSSESFIISPQTYSDSAPLEINIKGYYFKINNISDIVSNFSSATDIYAYIVIDTSNEYYHELKGQDINSEYQGLYFDSSDSWSSPDANTETYKLKLFERGSTSDDWTMSKSSFIMFADINSDIDIDGGVVS